MSSKNGVNPPTPNPSTNRNFSLLSVLGRERLTGLNYMEWMRNLRFTLSYENKEYVLDEEILTINDDSTQEEIKAHQKHYNDANKVSCIMASSMSLELQKLESLNMVFDTELSINIILSDLLTDYNQFVLSYKMNRKETSLMELHSLLQTAEQGIKKSDVPYTLAAPVLTVGHNAKKRKTSHSNWKGKATQGKSDCGSNRKVESEIGPTSDPKEAVCFDCNTKGHWKCSCPKYPKDLKDGKGLKESRRLKHGELNLVMGNKKITPVTRIGKYELMLKSKVRITLNNCCYSSEMTRNIILFHALFKDGYQFSFDNENGDILVYSNGCFMFEASPCKGIYETVECISNNGSAILNVGSSNELDKSKLWHSRLGHITKSSFTGTCERGEGLLDLVHTDVCGPFRSATKDGKRYYVTFTNDFSRYGYVYLIKHKSDIFNVFKMYQNEEENQLGRKIKDNVVFVARRGVFLEREMISKEDSGSKIDLDEIQESVDEEPIVNTDTQQEVVTPIEPDDISLPIRRTSSRVSKPSQDPQFYYGFHIEEDKISDSTLTELNEPANYKEAMASPKAAKWKEVMKSDIQSMYDNQVWNLVDTTPGLKTVGWAGITVNFIIALLQRPSSPKHTSSSILLKDFTYSPENLYTVVYVSVSLALMEGWIMLKQCSYMISMDAPLSTCILLTKYPSISASTIMASSKRSRARTSGKVIGTFIQSLSTILDFLFRSSLEHLTMFIIFLFWGPPLLCPLFFFALHLSLSGSACWILRLFLTAFLNESNSLYYDPSHCDNHNICSCFLHWGLPSMVVAAENAIGALWREFLWECLLTNPK
ncbi:retrotransposon protein, putative, ty1-copia subclass [Tanacetum coccineum]|uniref:Retrotransposon protein, putative, ty1-copia subclass n=1 Tax=Tanacetum coccineum TaxID=301880 RepID=A0ABQ5IY42_9ASTR